MGGYGVVGQVINVPVDVNNVVTTPPSQLDDDYSFNVHLKRNLIHKSTYLQGCIKKPSIILRQHFILALNKVAEINWYNDMIYFQLFKVRSSSK
jgi:hypothetical protein